MTPLSRNKQKNESVSITVEHLEPVLGEWIWLEYKHASKMVGKDNILFANVKNRKEASKLTEIGKVTSKSVTDLGSAIAASAIVLDPQSRRTLSPQDFRKDTSLVVGGILGDYPARGRTREAITMKMQGSQNRNLGVHQFSIDGAINIALQVAAGKKISEIPVRVGLEVVISKHNSNFLPFAYPLMKGKPLLTPGLSQYLKRGILADEETLFRTGRPRSVA